MSRYKTQSLAGIEPLRPRVGVPLRRDPNGKLSQLGFRPHTIDTELGAIRVWEAEGGGSFPTIACLHGYSFESADLAALLEALRPYTRRIIAADLLGHGESQLRNPELTSAAVWRGVQIALDTVIEEPAVLYGHSLGGFAALKYALERPGNIARLILHAPSGASMSQRELAHVLGVFEVDDLVSAEKLVAHLWEREPGVDHGALATQWLNRLSDQTLRSLLRTRIPGDSLTTSHLSGLHVPTLVLWAERDRILPPRCLDFFGSLPDARLEIVPGWGHCATERDVPQLAKRIHEFLASQPPDEKPAGMQPITGVAVVVGKHPRQAW